MSADSAFTLEKALAATGALIGVVSGFFLDELKAQLSMRKKHRAYWAALSAEINSASKFAQVYMFYMITSPQYRLPDRSFTSYFTQLLADGAVTERERIALTAFFTEVDIFNRSLGSVAEAKDEQTRQKEYRRNLLRAERLASGRVYRAAARCARAHTYPITILAQIWIKRSLMLVRCSLLGTPLYRNESSD